MAATITCLMMRPTNKDADEAHAPAEGPTLVRFEIVPVQSACRGYMEERGWTVLADDVDIIEQAIADMRQEQELRWARVFEGLR